MRPFLLMFFIVLFFTFSLVGQETFQRLYEIPTGDFEVEGFGNVIAGVDFDGNGLPEIYLCNTNMVDSPEALIPRLYKFEWNPVTETWDNTWTATSDIPLQNTWPALAWGDLDGDGKPEIYWGPVNWTTADNPNPARILVYEHQGNGSGNLGVDDGLGGFLPNAQWTIVDEDFINLRPIRFIVADIDGDGQEELVFSDRAGYMHYGVVSVDDIPDFGGGSETWTLKGHGLDDPVLTGTGAKWDFTIANDVIYLFAGSGLVYPVKYDGENWVALDALSNVGDENGSFKGAVTYDIDGDGTEEIILGGWFDAKVYVLIPDADTLITHQIADLTELGGVRLLGAAAGDLNGNGMVDFVFGSRHDAGNIFNNPMFRVAYKGGDITDPANYEASIIDSLLYPITGGDMDVVAIANIDGDPADELIYTMGYPRGGSAPYPTANVAILGLEFTPVSVKYVDANVPDNFYLYQNYPNPFNPSTTITFGLTMEMVVELKVYDVLGKEIMTLIDNDVMSAGSYDVTFDASRLPSGTYFYRLKAGDNVSLRKMMLLK